MTVHPVCIPALGQTTLFDVPFLFHTRNLLYLFLKVVGNEKGGGSGSRLLIE